SRFRRRCWGAPRPVTPGRRTCGSRWRTPIARWPAPRTDRTRSAWSTWRTRPGRARAPEKRLMAPSVREGKLILTECDSCAEGRASGASFCEACGRQLNETAAVSSPAAEDQASDEADSLDGTDVAPA